MLHFFGSVKGNEDMKKTYITCLTDTQSYRQTCIKMIKLCSLIIFLICYKNHVLHAAIRERKTQLTPISTSVATKKKIPENIELITQHPITTAYCLTQPQAYKRYKASYHTGYATRQFSLRGSHNFRPYYIDINPLTGPHANLDSIKWELMGDEMGWIVNMSGVIRFSSFSNVDNPILATNWTYHNNGVLSNVMATISMSSFSIHEYQPERSPEIYSNG